MFHMCYHGNKLETLDCIHIDYSLRLEKKDPTFTLCIFRSHNYRFIYLKTVLVCEKHCDCSSRNLS